MPDPMIMIVFMMFPLEACAVLHAPSAVPFRQFFADGLLSRERPTDRDGPFSPGMERAEIAAVNKE